MAPFSPFPRAHPRGKNCGGDPKIQVVYYSPSYCPMDSARHAPGRRVGTAIEICREETFSLNSLMQLNLVGARL